MAIRQHDDRAAPHIFYQCHASQEYQNAHDFRTASRLSTVRPCPNVDALVMITTIGDCRALHNNSPSSSERGTESESSASEAPTEPLETPKLPLSTHNPAGTSSARFYAIRARSGETILLLDVAVTLCRLSARRMRRHPRHSAKRRPRTY